MFLKFMQVFSYISVATLLTSLKLYTSVWYVVSISLVLIARSPHYNALLCTSHRSMTTILTFN